MTKKRIRWIVLVTWPVLMIIIRTILVSIQKMVSSQEINLILNFLGWGLWLLLLLSPIAIIIGIILIIKGKKI